MSKNYTVEPFPPERRIIVDAVRLGQQRRVIHGLIEVDVTEVRPVLHERGLSFTGFLVACMGKAIEQNKGVHALRDWRGRLVIYEDVDISMTIETVSSGKKFPVAHVVRQANRRNVADITAEIRDIQQNPKKSATLSAWTGLVKLFFWLPAWLRMFVYRILLLDPYRLQRTAGTAVLTAVGMFGEGGGWGLGMGIPLHHVGTTVGGIARKPGVVGDRIEIREILHLTVSFDHDVVDGAPAARFATDFKQLIESGHGL